MGIELQRRLFTRRKMARVNLNVGRWRRYKNGVLTTPSIYKCADVITSKNSKERKILEKINFYMKAGDTESALKVFKQLRLDLRYFDIIYRVAAKLKEDNETTSR